MNAKMMHAAPAKQTLSIFSWISSTCTFHSEALDIKGFQKSKLCSQIAGETYKLQEALGLSTDRKGFICTVCLSSTLHVCSID